MGLFNFFKSESKKKFVNESSFKKNRDNQILMTPQTLEQLRNLGIGEEDELKLEYFFYTNSLEKGESLANEIRKMNYTVEYKVSVADKNLYLVNGWTTKIKMSELVVSQWTKIMCELGYEFDSEFDEWGTNPEQEGL